MTLVEMRLRLTTEFLSAFVILGLIQGAADLWEAINKLELGQDGECPAP